MRLTRAQVNRIRHFIQAAHDRAFRNLVGLPPGDERRFYEQTAMETDSLLGLLGPVVEIEEIEEGPEEDE